MTTAVQAPLRERYAQWWHLRTRTERTLLALAAAVLVAACGWFIFWQPMQRDAERMNRELGAQRAALAEANRRAEDIATLSRNASTPAPRDARADLDAVLARRGVKPTAIERIDNDRMRVTFDGIGFDALPPLLEALQREAKLRAVEVTVTGRVEPGQVRVELTLAP